MILEQELKGKTLSPQEVRNILKTDNKEIVELCKRASIMPKKNSKGQTYFSYEEVKNLRKVQAMKGVNKPLARTEAKPSAMLSILSSLKEMENKLSSRIAKVIDEKLEGMDEVVVELIRCKTDNETLRQKIIDLNKEIYQLKNDLHAYKPVGLGFYKKREKQAWE
ncbi:unknown [Clostridium sp. CAG:967]|nr:unknown [Clostridium sp. CAG:967]